MFVEISSAVGSLSEICVSTHKAPGIYCEYFYVVEISNDIPNISWRPSIGSELTLVEVVSPTREPGAIISRLGRLVMELSTMVPPSPEALQLESLAAFEIDIDWANDVERESEMRATVGITAVKMTMRFGCGVQENG